jgi:predicted dienelactone hydrolase
MKPLLALLLLSTTAYAETLPGLDRLTLDAPHRPKVLEALVWYPAANTTYPTPLGANPVFLGTNVQVGPIPTPGAHPVLILSHGSGGNIENLGWLAEGLVARGAIVAGLNHPRSTSGDSNPRDMPNVSDRVADLATLIDGLTTNPTFAPLVDPARITALGFSLGGGTVLAAAGARLDADAYAAYCDAHAPTATDCTFMQRGGVDWHNLPPSWEADMRLPAITGAIAVDPGFSHAMTDASLSAIPIPVHLINLGDAPVQVNVGPNGSNLAAHIPNASYSLIEPASHFSFLGLCNPDAPAILAEVGEDPICDDPAGSDRPAVHARIINEVAAAMGL